MFIEQIKGGLDLTKNAENIAGIFDTYLEPGKQIPSHQHADVEEIYYILSGYGLMTLGDEQQEIKRGDVIHIPPTMTHALENTGNVPLRFITMMVKTR